MATVVAENTKEEWEVKAPLCVVRVHTCASRWRSWSWKMWFLDVKKAPLSCRQGGYSEEQTGCVRGARAPRINNTGPQRVRNKQNTSQHVITDQLTSADAHIQFEQQKVETNNAIEYHWFIFKQPLISQDALQSIDTKANYGQCSFFLSFAACCPTRINNSPTERATSKMLKLIWLTAFVMSSFWQFLMPTYCIYPNPSNSDRFSSPPEILARLISQVTYEFSPVFPRSSENWCFQSSKNEIRQLTNCSFNVGWGFMTPLKITVFAAAHTPGIWTKTFGLVTNKWGQNSRRRGCNVG